jgi:hypothetical protein
MSLMRFSELQAWGGPGRQLVIGRLLRCAARPNNTIQRESGHAMILEQGTAEAEVKIRMPRHAWMFKLAAGVLWLACAAFYLWSLQLVLAALVSLVVSSVLVASALWHRNLGVDLTRESRTPDMVS